MMDESKWKRAPRARAGLGFLAGVLISGTSVYYATHYKESLQTKPTQTTLPRPKTENLLRKEPEIIGAISRTRDLLSEDKDSFYRYVDSYWQGSLDFYVTEEGEDISKDILFITSLVLNPEVRERFINGETGEDLLRKGCPGLAVYITSEFNDRLQKNPELKKRVTSYITLPEKLYIQNEEDKRGNIQYHLPAGHFIALAEMRPGTLPLYLNPKYDALKELTKINNAREKEFSEKE